MKTRITGFPVLVAVLAALLSSAALAQEAAPRESIQGGTRAVGDIPYFKIAKTPGFPGGTHCNAPAHHGRMIFNPDTGDLYICVASGWIVK